MEASTEEEELARQLRGQPALIKADQRGRHPYPSVLCTPPPEPIIPTPLSKEGRGTPAFLGLSVLWVMGRDLLEDVISILRHAPDSIYHL